MKEYKNGSVNVSMPVLSREDRGCAVALLKMLLCLKGFSNDCDTPDYFGYSVLDALKAYQKSRGLDMTGVADKATWEKILTEDEKWDHM